MRSWNRRYDQRAGVVDDRGAVAVQRRQFAQSRADVHRHQPGEHDAAGDVALLHQRVAFGRLRERQHAADERLHRAGGEEMQRDVHVVERRVAGTGDADAPHDDEAGIDLDRPRADIAEHHHESHSARTERRLSPNVPVTTFSSITSTPCLPVSRQTSPLNFRSGLTMISSAPACADRHRPCRRELVTAMHARLHALGDLDLMQAEPAARAGDQHGLARPGLRDAERRAHAGADRTDRERRRRQVDARPAPGWRCAPARRRTPHSRRRRCSPSTRLLRQRSCRPPRQ